MTTERLNRLRDALAPEGFAAAAIVPGANMHYLAGLDIHLSERLALAFIPSAGQPAVMLPALEAPRAQAQATAPLRFYPWDDAEGPEPALRRCVAELGLAGARVGVEYTAMRVLELRALEGAAPGVRVEDLTPILSRLRMVKDAAELAAMRTAARIVEEGLRAAIERIHVGMTERELADAWEQGMRAAGGATSFGTIIASGPNSANPHHSNSDRAFQPGDLIIMDGGALHDGYASDITRTIAVGEPGPQARRIYELVQAANAAGRAAVHPGTTGEQIDQAARAVIAEGGYGPQFLHRTGHGLGLEVHEPPYIVAGSRAPLAIGTTFTVEPGIYLAGQCGVRIEDDVVVAEGGVESLTSFERDLIIVKG